MLFSQENQWVYLSPPKCGTHTIRKVIKRPPVNAVSDGSDFHCMSPPDGIPCIYASIRHPVSRAVSLWGHYRSMHPVRARVCRDRGLRLANGWRRLSQGEFPLGDFLKGVLDERAGRIRPDQRRFDPFYTRTLSDWLRGIDVTECIRLESINLDMHRIFGVRSVPCLNRRRRSRMEPPTNPTEREVQMIREWAEEDFTRFGYEN